MTLDEMIANGMDPNTEVEISLTLEQIDLLIKSLEPQVHPLCPPSWEELQPLHAGRHHSFTQPHQQHQTQQAGRQDAV